MQLVLRMRNVLLVSWIAFAASACSQTVSRAAVASPQPAAVAQVQQPPGVPFEFIDLAGRDSK